MKLPEYQSKDFDAGRKKLFFRLESVQGGLKNEAREDFSKDWRKESHIYQVYRMAKQRVHKTRV